MEVRLDIGDDVPAGQSLARVWAYDADLESVAGKFFIEQHREELLDFHFASEEIAEVAIRALSPGVNDPGTAVSSIDDLKRW